MNPVSGNLLDSPSFAVPAPEARFRKKHVSARRGGQSAIAIYRGSQAASGKNLFGLAGFQIDLIDRQLVVVRLYVEYLAESAAMPDREATQNQDTHRCSYRNEFSHLFHPLCRASGRLPTYESVAWVFCGHAAISFGFVRGQATRAQRDNVRVLCLFASTKHPHPSPLPQERGKIVLGLQLMFRH